MPELDPQPYPGADASPPALAIAVDGGLPTIAIGTTDTSTAVVAGNFDPQLINAAPRPDQRTIAVLSSKGGSGKTTCAVCLATGIRRASIEAVATGAAAEPLSVCLVDLDVRDGQVGTVIGLHTPTALSVRAAPFIDEQTIRSNLVHAAHLGLDVMLAPNRPRAADGMGSEFYRSLLTCLQRLYDVVVLDCSVNYLDPLLGKVALPMATQVLLVTTPFRTSVYGVTRAISEMIEPAATGGLGVAPSRVGLVVNQATGDDDVDLADVMQAVSSIPVVGKIPVAPHQLMLDATNTCRMDLLLDTPDVGPAIYNLAQRVLPGLPLVQPRPAADVDIWGAQPADALGAADYSPVPPGQQWNAQPVAPSQPVAPVPPAAAPVPVAAPQTQAAEPTGGDARSRFRPWKRGGRS